MNLELLSLTSFQLQDANFLFKTTCSIETLFFSTTVGSVVRNCTVIYAE